MVFLDVDKINSIIEQIPYVELVNKFVQNGHLGKGIVLISNIEGLEKSLEFEVEIHSQYPLKHHDTETIRFINKDLLEYNHVMENGSICIHTLHSPNLEKKLIYDFNSLKNWIIKYYINKDKDVHYEHILINENVIDNIYYSFQFTEVDYSFRKGEFGIVDLIHLNNGIYKKKRIENFLVKSFISNRNNTINCLWSDYYMNQKKRTTGLFVFVEDTPALYNRFAFNNWVELKNYLPQEFLNLLNKFRDRNKKLKNSFVPVFIGYTTVDNEIHWITALVNLKDFPTKGIPVTNSKGEKIKGKWQSKLIDKKINWAITRNSSHKYFFGRGKYSDKLVNSKILIIGVGAVGSIVAKTLVKCGVKQIDLVDYDVKEPENVCRSEYWFSSGLTNKVEELRNILVANSPFVDVEIGNEEYFESIIKVFYREKEHSQNFEKLLSEYDIIFDCTTDNDLMYILNSLDFNSDLINLSITNHAKDLVCAFHPNAYDFVNNQFNNILNNDVEDLYNPTGCWSPTFKASFNDINILVQYALKQINSIYENNKLKNNFTISFDKDNNIKLREY